MEILLWAAMFVGSLFVLTKGANVFIANAEKVGIWIGLPPFVIGVLIVGVGTSLPELAGAIAAVFQGATEIVTANAIGSNITNILLVIGVLATVGGKLVTTKDLIDIELPLFAIATTLFIGVAFDGSVTIIEAALLFATFVIYLVYLLTHEKNNGESEVVAEKEKEVHKEKRKTTPKFKTLLFLGIGLIGLLIGAHFLIRSVIEVAGLIGVGVGVISLTAIALGTSLPELFVSLQALRSKKIDLAIGNIFGSNAFNILMAVGIPGLLGTLVLDEKTLTIGLPIMAAASFIFLIATVSRNIYRWEGMMFLVFYAFFVLKLFGV